MAAAAADDALDLLAGGQGQGVLRLELADHQVHALGETGQALLQAQLRHGFVDALHVRSGGVDRQPRANGKAVAVDAVRDPRADHPARLAQQPVHLQVVGHLRPVPGRTLDDGQGHALGAVHVRLPQHLRAGETRDGREQWRPLPGPPGRQKGARWRLLAAVGDQPVDPGAAQGVEEHGRVHGRPALHQRARLGGHEEGQPAGQVRRDVLEDSGFPVGFAHLPELALGQIADTAVQQFGRGRGGERAKIALFHQGHAQAAQRGVMGDKGAGDAAADDQQIELLGGKRCEVAVHGVWCGRNAEVRRCSLRGGTTRRCASTPRPDRCAGCNRDRVWPWRC